jgi:hypothetical protein
MSSFFFSGRSSTREALQARLDEDVIFLWLRKAILGDNMSGTGKTMAVAVCLNTCAHKE